MVPYYLAALLQPHGTLLYWLTNATAFHAMQLAFRAPSVASTLKLPAILTMPLQPPPEQSQQQQLDAGLLLALGAEYGAKRRAAAATACYGLAAAVTSAAGSLELAGLSSILEKRGQWQEVC